MRRATVVLGLTGIVALFGCASTLSQVPPAAKTVTCNNNNPCVATVAIADPATHKATVDPDKIVVEKSKRTHLYWQLPANCAFVTTYGDGVFVKSVGQAVDAATQFEEQFAADAVANNKPKREQISSLYYWFAKNDKKSTDGGYVYRVTFHCKYPGTSVYDDVAYVADPIIFNDGP